MIMPLSFSNPVSTRTYYLAIQIVYNSDLDKTTKDVSNQTTSNNHNLKSGLTYNSMFVVGDSITAGHPYESEIGIHWWEILSRNYGFNITFGARSGSGYVFQSGGKNAIDLVANVDWQLYDQVIFNFGTNDYGKDEPIGTINDMYDGQGDYTNLTVCGSLNYLIKKVLTSNPLCNVIIVLPLNRKTGSFANNYAFGTQNNIGKTLNDYCEAIIGCCNKYGINYIDRRHSVVNAYTIQGGQLLVDGLHPSKNGYKIIGSELASRIGAIIKPYIEYNPNDNDKYYGIESLD
jgi:lysophospholipase L1-like esterase